MPDYGAVPTAEAAPTAARRVKTPVLGGLAVILLVVAGFALAGNSPADADAETTDLKVKTVKLEAPDMSTCTNPHYTDLALKTAADQSVIALIQDLKGEKKFEASDVIVHDNKFYVVFDNSYAIGEFATNLPMYSGENRLIGEPEQDSGYEALVYNHDTENFYVVIESESIDGDFHAVVEELNFDTTEDTYMKQAACASEFTFTSGNKGFEGAVGFKRSDGQFYLLGLCEGNFCDSGKKGREAGNGRMVLMVLGEDDDGMCLWKTVEVAEIPSEASFIDWSAIALWEERKVAITSQESSQVYIADFDIETLAFTNGKVLDFPRGQNCEVVYCNIEGIHFLNEDLLVAVSDKMKRGGKQPYTCLQKDQSVHLFVMP